MMLTPLIPSWLPWIAIAIVVIFLAASYWWMHVRK